MGHPRIQMLTWTLCVLLSWMCVRQAEAGPQYMVAIPSLLEAGTRTKVCASLLQPNETLVMTVTLMSKEKNTTLLQRTSNEDFHDCISFEAPLVQEEDVQKLEVEVRGDTFYSKEVRKILIRFYRPVTFVQTDKPIYRPGQTVRFRVVSLNNMFRPVSLLYDIIELKDTNRNRIGQWLNQTSNGKILQLSYSLNSEAREGGYSITVSAGEDTIYHRFEVKKYVLPKFDVVITAPEAANVKQEEITAKVCATYTYGLPVQGSVEFEVCRPRETAYGREFPPNATVPCYKETKQTEKTGCATFTFKMSIFTKLDPWLLQNVLEYKAKVEEEGTGISRHAETRWGISYVVGRLFFIDTPRIYEEGAIVEGKVKALDHTYTPIPGMSVYLLGDALFQNLTTDSHGVAAFTVNTTRFEGKIHMHLSNKPTQVSGHSKVAHFETAGHTLSLAQLSSLNTGTGTMSSLEVRKKGELPCDREEVISIKYTIVGEAPGSVDIIYLVLFRGTIDMQGFKKIEIQDKAVTAGEISFKLTVSAEMAPAIKVVAYAVLPSENVLADSADFSTEKCFSHKVSLEFSLSSAVPGDETKLRVKAQPDSLCGISAFDQSLLIEEPWNTLYVDRIFNLLPAWKTYRIPEAGDPEKCLDVIPAKDILPYHRGGFAHNIFKRVGLKMATNLLIQRPSCLKFRGRQYDDRIGCFGYHPGPDDSVVAIPLRQPGEPGPLQRFDESVSDDISPVETVRTFFPETWIWDLVEVGASGTKDMSLTVPDTITAWHTEAFCLSSQGFGLAPRSQLTVFQPFFLELTLPYSIIRGEHFELKATVFNYLPSCVMVTVTPAPSLDYTLTPLSDDPYTSCLCANDRKTFSWNMVPSALGVMNVTVTAEAVASHVSCGNEIVSVPERGRIDVVTQPLIVKAEGTEMTKTHNWLLCPKGEVLTEEIDIELPENVINGSARATLSVLGDILGRALNNLAGLLRMPYGCGEQNMALLAPNIYILQYLNNTQQLTPAIREKSTNYLTRGYQRQLNYKHPDGAYSTFMSEPGNTWLTAFVLRSFAKAQSFVYIDPEKIEESKSWLDRKQQENGCFEQSGKLFNNRMKGGVSDEVTLSAYITAAFLEMNASVNDPVVNRSLSCLRESMSDLNNTYTTALLAYVFTLAGDMEARSHLLKHLDTVAIEDSDFLHWSQTATETSASLSVEISSYVLLAKLSASPTDEDLGYAARIIRWLTGQQNYYGGFSSTQDTVVALQALALYSTLTFSPGRSGTVTVQSPSGQLIFDVNQNNELIYQEEVLQNATGKYNLEVKGTTCASVQISLFYNIPALTDVTSLSLEVKPQANCTSKSQRPKLTLKFKSLYSGRENVTNMVILDIKMLSGFVPDPESLTELKGALLVDLVEQKGDRVLVYLQELPKDIPIYHSLEIVQKHPVENLKPAVVKIYDYYQTNDQAETEYSCPCVAA